MSHSRPNACGSPEHAVHRRQFLQGALAATAAGLSCGGLDVAQGLQAADSLRHGQKHVLYLWLAGGSSQFETWDPKPGRPTGGPFQAISTAVAGVQVCELMPKTARLMDKLALIRSLDTEITAHAPAADLINTGRKNEPALVYPEFGVVLSKQLSTRDPAAPAEVEVPDYVSLFLSSEGRFRPGVGYLGARHAPLHLDSSLRPKHIDAPPGLSGDLYAERESLRNLVSNRFARQRAGGRLVEGYNSAFQKVRGLMRSERLFDLEQEPAAVRSRYGKTAFGEHCLLARRLIEGGVPIVKVARGFWDSHHDNFESHRELVTDFDRVFSTLLEDLDERGLLDSTLVIVLSEFGRTPKINPNVGRDHYAAAWSCALAGLGIRGGVVHGQTDEDGISVADGKADAGDVLATIFQAAGIDPQKHEYVGPRPVPLAPEESQVIETVLA